MCICSLKDKSSLFPTVAPAQALAARTFRAPVGDSTSASNENAGAIPRALPAEKTARSRWSRRHHAVSDSHSSTRTDKSAAIEPLTAASTPETVVENAADARFESQEAEVSEATPIPIDPVRAQFLQTLQRAKEGDKKAFEEIYQLYHRRIYNAVYGMLSDPDDAQDVTQDVFMRLHDALPTLRADEAFSTYLYRIALNLCRDRARRKKRVRFQSMDTPRADSEGDVEPMEFPDQGKLPEETMANDELQTRVRQAVQTLSVDHKAVIVMHHFQGMEVNDIANILKVPTGTVKSRLARGRDQLHRKLKSYVTV